MYTIRGVAGENYNKLTLQEQAQVQAAGDAAYQAYRNSIPDSAWNNTSTGYQNSAPQVGYEAAQRAAESIFTQRSNTLQQQNEQMARDMNSFIASNPNASSLPSNIDPTGKYAVVNGVLTEKSAISADAANKAGVANGTLIEVSPGMYIPKGSAADANQVNIGTNNTANAANTQSTPATTTTTGAGSTGTGTSLANKPSGINLINTTLNLGSQGDQVKALQQYLSGIGYIGSDGKPLKVDGIYGPETKTAVMQFQSKNGLTPDGIFGPKSLAKTKEFTSTGSQVDSAPPGSSAPGSTSNSINPSNPNDGGTIYNTGDPTQDALLAELQAMIKAQQDAGLKLNEALNFDQATLDKFLETAKKQVHPFYAQQIDTIKADVLRTAPQILQEYGNEIEKKKAAFESTLDSSRENNAERGLAFSGQRAKGELGMQTEQDRNLAALNQGYGNKLYDLGRGAEEKIGAGNMQGYNLGALANYKADLGGNGGFNINGTSSPYSPGGFKIGSLEYDRESATEQRNQALKKTASEAVVAGRGYQDLFA